MGIAKGITKKNEMAHNLRAKYASLKLRFLRWRMASYIRARKVGRYFNYFSLSIVGIFIAFLLHTRGAQQAILQYRNVDTLFIAIGGMLGTIIALVFTLSIIPIQQAVESFSPSVSWIYRNDRVTQIIYVLLALFCIGLFIFSIEDVIPVGKTQLLPVGIALIGIAFDLLRWHYLRIGHMLDPGTAIQRLTTKTLDHITDTHKRISRLAQIQWDMLNPEQKANQTKTQIETALYISSKNLQYPIINWTGELAEISYKAIGKNEIYTSELAISALSEIACRYLDVRKDTMIVYGSPDALFLSSESDVNTVLSPIYEHLKNANRYAVTLKVESASINVIRALGRIARHTASLNSPAFRQYSAPITFMPLSYLKECILSAQRSGLDDPVLKGSKELLNVTVSVPPNTQITDVYSPAIDAWNDIMLTYLLSGKAVFANEVTNDLMAFLHTALKQKHFDFNHLLSDVLTKIEGLCPYAIAYEKTFGSPFVGLPLSVPYDRSNQRSLAYLVAAGNILIEKHEDKPRLNPYHDFIEINETLYRHIRNLAEKVNFGSSFLMWHIIQTIKHISRVYLSLLDSPVTDDLGHKEALIKQVPWYLSFFWVAFSKSSPFDLRRAEEACDVLAWIGMSFHTKGYTGVTESCIGNISAIADSYCKSGGVNAYDLADLLMPLWYLRLLAESRNNTGLLKKIEEKLSKPSSLPDERWPEVQSALEVRKSQLDLRRRPDFYDSIKDDARSLLSNLLQSHLEDATE